MRTKNRIKNDWPQTWYGPGGESESFSERMYVPLGWTPYPQLKTEPKLERIITNKGPSRVELKALLEEAGIKVDPRWSVAKMKELL